MCPKISEKHSFLKNTSFLYRTLSGCENMHVNERVVRSTWFPIPNAYRKFPPQVADFCSKVSIFRQKWSICQNLEVIFGTFEISPHTPNSTLHDKVDRPPRGVRRYPKPWRQNLYCIRCFYCGRWRCKYRRRTTNSIRVKIYTQRKLTGAIQSRVRFLTKRHWLGWLFRKLFMLCHFGLFWLIDTHIQGCSYVNI